MPRTTSGTIQIHTSTICHTPALTHFTPPITAARTDFAHGEGAGALRSLLAAYEEDDADILALLRQNVAAKRRERGTAVIAGQAVPIAPGQSDTAPVSIVRQG